MLSRVSGNFHNITNWEMKGTDELRSKKKADWKNKDNIKCVHGNRTGLGCSESFSLGGPFN